MVQPQVALVAAMTASEAAIPPLPPYIVAEALQGAAYRALPSPKASVLSAVIDTVSDLNIRFTKVTCLGCTIALSSLMAINDCLISYTTVTTRPGGNCDVDMTLYARSSGDKL